MKNPLLLGLLMLVPGLLQAQLPVTDNQCPPDLDRPCVALVLGGGGARGGAHVGVLEMLARENIPVDMVVGTSIGAFVGALYATGKSPEQIRTLFLETDWNIGYRDEPGRGQTTNRRKRQVDDFPVQLNLGFDGLDINLPLGLIQGQGMKTLVDQMLGIHPTFASFNDLPIPFRAVAADVETGDAVVLDSGDLATALQSSMSLPGILRPIEHNGQLLVDGGIANNLPVDVAKSMGADVVIAVDIRSANLTREALVSGVNIIQQLTLFLTQDNVLYQRSLLEPQDIIIQPQIENVGVASFERIGDAIDAGRAAAEQALMDNPRLTALARNQAQPVPALPVQTVRIDDINLTNRTRLADDYILDRMGLQSGQLFSASVLHQGIDRLYGQGTIARVNTTLDNNQGSNVLNIVVDEREWGPGFLDFKLGFEDDFRDRSRYQMGAAFRLTNLSPFNAEWYTTVELGTEKDLYSDIYWPIRDSGFFINAAGEYSKRNFVYALAPGEIAADGASGDVNTTEYASALGLGWNLSDHLDLILSSNRVDGRARLSPTLSGPAGFSALDYRQTGTVLQANYDRLDSAMFPREGWKMTLELGRGRDDYLNAREYTTTVNADYDGVVSRGRHSLRGQLRYQSFVNKDPLSLLGRFQLGGFLNLSGHAQDALSGQHVRFASAVYTYELAANDFGARRLPLYLGASLETGNAWEKKDDISYRELLSAGSVFLGWNSPLGPAYLAYGRGEGGQRSLYLFLGLTF